MEMGAKGRPAGPGWSRWWLAWREAALVVVCAGVLASQLLLPGFIGMADNGDFPKIAGRLSLGPADSRAQKFAYFESDYVRDRRYHWDSRLPSSEMIPAKVASAVEKAIGDRRRFDIRWLGAVHAAIFVGFYFLLLKLLRPLRSWRWLLLAPVALWIFADVAFVAYFNSFYTETAALLGAMIATVMAVHLLKAEKAQPIPLILFTLGALFFVTSKVQHGIHGFLPACCTLAIALEAKGKGMRLAAWAATACLLGGIVWIFAGTQAWYSGLTRFNLIFFQIAKNSDTPLQDLQELGLNATDLPYVGMHAFMLDSPMGDDRWLADFCHRTSYGKVLRFYVRHPGRMLAILQRVLLESASQRQYLGLSNFRRQQGRPPYAITGRFGSWSVLRTRLFQRWPFHILVWYALVMIGAPVIFLHRKRGFERALACVTLAVALAGIGEFCVPALADACEMGRHLLLFHLLTDFTIFLALTFALTPRADAQAA